MVHNNKPYATNEDRHAAILAAKRKWYQKNKAKVQAYGKAYYANKKATLNNNNNNALYFDGNIGNVNNRHGGASVNNRYGGASVNNRYGGASVNNRHENSVIIGNQKYILKKITVPVTNNTYSKNNKRKIQKNKHHSKNHSKHHSKRRSKHHSKRRSKHHGKYHNKHDNNRR